MNNPTAEHNHRYVARITQPGGSRVTRDVWSSPERIVDVAFQGAHVDSKVEWQLAGVGRPTCRTSNPARWFHTEEQAVSYNRGYVDRRVTNAGLLDFSALGFHDAEQEDDNRRERVFCS